MNRYKDTGPLAQKIDLLRANKAMKKNVSTGLKRATIRFKRSKLNQDLGIEKRKSDINVLGDLDSTRGSVQGSTTMKVSKTNDKTYDMVKDPLITTDYMGAALE